MNCYVRMMAALACYAVLAASNFSAQAQNNAPYYIPDSQQSSVYDGTAQYGEEGDWGDGQYTDGYCTDGCSDGSCGTGGSLDSDCPPGSLYFTADYLYVRSSFSEAVSYVDQNANEQGIGSDTFHELDFQYESSYRFGGGYRLSDCCEQIRFMFTRLSSYATDATICDCSLLPYGVSAPPDGRAFIDGNVDVKSYDLEYAKTIPLGGTCGGGCGDACGCGDSCGGSCGCGSCCPVWDITWSGGMRFAQVNSSRSFVAVDEGNTVTTDAVALMNFDGGGARFGMEGRRYFGSGGWLSAYLKGDISLLLGQIDLRAQRVVEGGTAPDLTNIQTLHHRQIVPVTEIETGLTGHITCSSSLTAGYLFQAWHDLGYRDSFNFPTFMETSYDDANILGFDGLFARLEVGF